MIEGDSHRPDAERLIARLAELGVGLPPDQIEALLAGACRLAACAARLRQAEEQGVAVRQERD